MIKERNLLDPKEISPLKPNPIIPFCIEIWKTHGREGRIPGYSVGDFRGWCSVQTSFWSSWPCLISLTCFSLLPSFSSFCLSPNHQSQNVVSISSTISISSYTFFPSFKSQPHKHTFLLSFIIIIIITHLNPFRKYT